MSKSNGIALPLIGGLGNQLFQYFAGQYLAREFNQKITYLTSHPSLRTSKLNKVAISDFLFTEQDLFLNPNFTKSDLKMLSLAIRMSTEDQRLNRIKSQLCSNYFNVRQIQGNKFKLGISNNLGFSDSSRFEGKNLIVGYFQSYVFFDDLVHQSMPGVWQQKIRTSLHNMLDLSRWNIDDGTLLHVRRGDYVGQKFGLLSSTYYEQALEAISLNGKLGKLYLISDGSVEDVSLLPKSIASRVQYIETKDLSAAVILSLISKFRNIVIANSSLSWWGAKWGELVNSTKVIVAPEPWFQSVSSPQRIIPRNWLTVKEDIWIV